MQVLLMKLPFMKLSLIKLPLIKAPLMKYQQLAANVLLALASFLVAYLLLQEASPADYGSFTFVLVLQALGMALINALVASPLLILMNSGTASALSGNDQRRSGGQAFASRPDGNFGAIKGFLVLALTIASVIALVQGAYLWFVSADIWLSCSMALAGWLQLLRWYCRCEWQNRQVSLLVRSDFLFSGVLMVSVLVVWGSNWLSLPVIALLLLLSAMVALQPFIRGMLNVLRASTDWRATKSGFSRQGKPALFGVLTVEATANFHSYVLVLLSGGAAFAPIAAAMLFFRPLAVVFGSLQQSERPLLVKALSSEQFELVRQLSKQLQWVAIWAFVANVVVLVVVDRWLPQWLWPDVSSRMLFINAMLLWSLIALLRALRSPATALLQAADQFSPLARATYASALFTVPLVLLCWWLGGPIASLWGVLAGEVVLGVWLVVLVRRLPFCAAGVAKD